MDHLYLIILVIFVPITLVSAAGSETRTQVTCFTTENCTLPCSFTINGNLVVHWKVGAQATDQGKNLYSYYQDKPNLSTQDPIYKDRVDVPTDKLRKRNASLVLMKTTMKDAVSYMCYVSSESGNIRNYVKVTVQAPVRKVHVETVGDTIVCDSQGINPEPSLAWLTSPWSNVTEQNETKSTAEKLYNISSTLRTSNTTDGYTCIINNSISELRTSWYRPSYLNSSGGQARLSCRNAGNASKRLTWTYNGTQIILTQNGNESYVVSQNWTDLVTHSEEPGVLTLKGLSSTYNGMYTCEQSDRNATHITHVILTIADGQSAVIVGAVIAVVVIVIIVLLILMVKYRQHLSEAYTLPRLSGKKEPGQCEENVQVPLTEC